MFHGNKKKEDSKLNKPLTEEETKKIELQLHKIKTIQKEILDRSNENNLEEKNLDFLIKAASVMPDFYSLWNYRKKIILGLKSKKSSEEFYNFLKTEIKQISILQKGNPKSYNLWYHRIWLLKNASEIEVTSQTSLDQSILTQEINNINFFLERDDRNFHVWNHRTTIFSFIKEYFPQNFSAFLTKELDFTLASIKKNCSNFSAWHYRSKLIPLFFQMNNIDWNSEEALNYFKTDLELITNAVYTDPKDQSPWTYHLWIVNNLTPVRVESCKVSEDEESQTHKNLLIKYSDTFKWKDLLRISDEGNLSLSLIPETGKDYSSAFKIKLNFGENLNGKFSIFSTEQKEEKTQISQINALTNNACFSKNNLSFPKIEVEYENKNYKIKINHNNFLAHQKTFLLSQIKMIDDLINTSESGFLEYAHLRKAQILLILKDTCNSEDSLEALQALEEKERLNYIKQINEEYEILQTNSKRMKTMYEKLSKKLKVN